MFVIFLFIADEIERQLKLSDARVLIGSPEAYEKLQQAVQLLKKDIPIICAKTEVDLPIPAGAIDFQELVNTSGKCLNHFRAYAEIFLTQ